MHAVIDPWNAVIDPWSNGLLSYGNINHLFLWVLLLLSCMIVCVLTLLTKSAHPSLWTGANVWSLAYTSVLTLEPTDSCTNTQNTIDTVMKLTQSQKSSSAISLLTEFQNTTQNMQHKTNQMLDVKTSVKLHWSELVSTSTQTKQANDSKTEREGE